MNNAFRVPLRAQGGMPEYRSQSIGPQAGANVSARLTDTAGRMMIGQAVRNAATDARDIERFNTGLQGFLKAGVGLYNDYRDKTSRAYIQEAVLRSQEEFAAWQADYDKTHQGEQGINAAADYEQAWARISATHMKGLRDKGVSGPYEQYADLQFRQNGLHYGKQGVAFQTQQDRRWKGSLADGAYAALENTVAANPDDHERIGAMKAQAYQAYALAHPGEDMRAFEDKVNNLVANTSIEARIAAGDFEGAQRDLAVYGNAGGVNNGHSIAEDHNNPLNEKAPGKNTGTREDFKVYASIEDGLRGNWGLLQRYQSRHNRRTLREIITRWAPPSENRTAQYIANVSQKAGIDADAPVNMRDIPTAARVIKAMAEQESPLGQRLTVPQIEAALKGENAKRPAMYVAYDNPEGLTEQGNIDIANRPQVRTPDGGTATVRSMSVNFDGAEVLLPTVSQDGRLLSEDEAIAEYRKTGKHLGKFDTPEHASDSAQKLHEQQEKMYLGPAARQQPGRAGAGWLTPKQQAAYEQSIRTGMERAQKLERLGAVQQLADSLRTLPAEERKAAGYAALDQVQDPEARKQMRTALDEQLTFLENKEKAEFAVQGRRIAAELRGMSLLERNEYFTQHNVRPEVQKIVVQQLDNNLETSSVAMSQARDDLTNGASMDDVSARYGALISAKGMEELRTFAASEERKAQHKKLTAFMSEMIAQSGMDMKNEDDKEYILGIKAEFEEAFNAGEFKTRDDQKNWIYERLARRRAPGMLWGENEYTPRKAAGREDAYIPVPAWEAENIRRQIFRETGISNPTPEQIQAVYNEQRGTGPKPVQRVMNPVDGSTY